MGSHAALISELEAAEEGSRKLSDEVLLALGWRIGEPRRAWAPNREFHFSDQIPDPSRNLQDGVNLVPERVSASATKHGNGRGAAELWQYVSQKYVLHAIRLDVKCTMKIGRRKPIECRKGELLVFKDRKPLKVMSDAEYARAKTRECNLPPETVPHQNIGAASPALALCIALLKAMETGDG